VLESDVSGLKTQCCCLWAAWLTLTPGICDGLPGPGTIQGPVGKKLSKMQALSSRKSQFKRKISKWRASEKNDRIKQKYLSIS